MKRLTLSLLALIMLSSTAFSQYRIWLKGEVDIKGIFYKATDSSIIIIPKNENWQEIDKTSLIEVQVNEIDKIKLRRLNSIGRGVYIGALIGAIPVGIAGVLLLSELAKAGDDDLDSGAGAAVILIAGGLGAGIGAVSGSNKTIYIIDYSQDRYLALRSAFEQKAIKAQEY